ncbi:DNA starvation/stationary phase protection protein [Cryobacterium melibiosiphilum]|uniref:DNA starvation/stationary phase protection protein n=1 Tax=Cryobacterium melibiosiphilum TaxID=995039 RepID=A0A3A5MZS9_9MICO|nr:DNA starvation/stationary phase protection protein [Cryobacterium melibiosiphilum]RJT90614.1 DNA starvation/stationary phase protection protein [Cryobacterium melibiosiphilum]
MHASETLSANLQSVLVDLIDLHVQGKQAHWNILGTNFRDLHHQLDTIVDDVREFSDQVAERMRALEAMPDGRAETVTATTHLPHFPAGEVSTTDAVGLITERLDTTVANIRAVHDEVDEEDPTSADILHLVIEKLEQHAWMVSAETRKPRTLAAVPSAKAAGSGSRDTE